MLFRGDDNQRIAITQPAHSWVSGQLARAWGNAEFGTFEPWESVCMAAEQHDIGWVGWELEPTLNRETGFPYSFAELPNEQHVRNWSGAGPAAAIYGRYVALLVSLHGTGLYERFGSAEGTSAQHQRLRDFLEREHAYQESLIESLRSDPRFSPYVNHEVVRRNQRLIAVWDWLSLLICGGFSGRKLIEAVPSASGERQIELRSDEATDGLYAMDPWPFGQPEVTLRFEGRVVAGGFRDERAMRAALVEASWQSLAIRLAPPRHSSA